MRITSAASLAKLLQYHFFFGICCEAIQNIIIITGFEFLFAILTLMCSFYCMQHFMSISHLAGRVI